MNLRTEILKLLKDDAAFRVDVMEIIKNELREDLEVIVNDYNKDDSTKHLTVDIKVTQKSPYDIKLAIMSELKKYDKEGFAAFWKIVPKEKRLRKESCRRMFAQICAFHSANEETAENMIAKFSFSSKSLFSKYNAIKDKPAPFDFLSEEL